MTYKLNPFTGKLDTSDGPQGPAGVVSAAGPGSQGTPSISFAADLDTGLYNYTPNGIAVSTGGTGRLFVDASGNVGINEASPSTYSAGAGVPSFVLKGNSGGYADRSGALALVSQDGTTAKTWIYHDTDLFIQSTEATNTRFYTNNTERLRITSDGKLGLGTSSVQEKLHVAGGKGSSIRLEYSDGGSTVGETAGSIYFYNGDLTGGTQKLAAAIKTLNTDNTYGRFSRLGIFTANGETTEAERLTITNAGNVGIGTTSPSAKLEIGGIASSGSLEEAFTIDRSDGTQLFSVGYNSSSNDVSLSSNNKHLVFANGTSSAETARIDQSGRLLVGTSSVTDTNPKFVVEGRGVSGTQPAQVHLRRSESAASITSGEAIGFIAFTDNADNQFAFIGCSADADAGSGDYPGRLVFSTTADSASSPTERMRIASNGSIYLGSQATANTGSFVTTAHSKIFTQSSTDSGTVGLEIYTNSTATRYLASFSNTNGVVGSINVTGSATAYTTSSDYRLKENVVPLTGAANRLNQLQVRRFNFIADPDTTVDGFIAHEAQAVVPECVTGTKDEVDADGNPVYQGIDQSKLVPLLTAALQEALAKIETQAGVITALDARLKVLEGN